MHLNDECFVFKYAWVKYIFKSHYHDTREKIPHSCLSYFAKFTPVAKLIGRLTLLPYAYFFVASENHLSCKNLADRKYTHPRFDHQNSGLRSTKQTMLVNRFYRRNSFHILYTIKYDYRCNFSRHENYNGPWWFDMIYFLKRFVVFEIAC